MCRGTRVHKIICVNTVGVAFFLLPFKPESQVRISEIMYDPPGPDKGYEWIEIVNETQQNIDIKNIRLWEADVRHIVKAIEGGEEILNAGETAVIVQDADIFQDEYPYYTGALFRASFSLRQRNNEGEEIGIIEGKNTPLSVTYTPDSRANGTGATLHIHASNESVTAPATPGEQAVNPITIKNKTLQTEEKTKEEEILEEVLEELEEGIEETIETEQTQEEKKDNEETLKKQETHSTTQTPIIVERYIQKREDSVDERLYTSEKTNKLLADIYIQLEEQTKREKHIHTILIIIAILIGLNTLFTCAQWYRKKKEETSIW